ncbi:hypothetical protein [Zobellia uliginosa]|uniref:hypothetical protein n=1 Tax=Zobellia uliginosa TaxID=143224 RepID=UPI0026E48402|nr:hypothetical protein [Zobellia uliginosa]MDO6516564.1 hypothetical protein [Zobellia uliginosa]
MKIADKLADWLDIFYGFKKNIRRWFFLKNTQMVFAAVMFFTILLMALYRFYQFGLQWYWYLVLLFGFVFLAFLILGEITRKQRIVEQQKQSPKNYPKGVDFNKAILDNIFYVLRNMEKIDIEKTRIDDFYLVMTSLFQEHESKIYFASMTWYELRYLLEKIKILSGIEYSAFEASQKIYLDEKPLEAKKLSNQGRRKNPSNHFMNKIDNCFPK